MGHNVLTISDRDIISNYKSIKDIKGINALNSKIISSFNNFNPEIVMGHADNIDTNTLEILKEKKIFKNSSMVFGSSFKTWPRLFE